MAGPSALRRTGRSSISPKMAYNKPYLTVQQQLALIQSRGMVITDLPKAEQMLQRIGYYRLSGYWYPFRDNAVIGGVRTVVDNFRPGADLRTIIDLYIFDKKLRLLFLDALERIEITLRVQICLLLGQYGRFAHRDPMVLHGNFARRTNPRTSRVEHQEWLRRTDEKFRDSKEDFAKHFRTRYPGENPPIWIACEAWDFGAMSYLFGGLQNKDQTAIAGEYGLTFDVLESWIRTLNVARNVCAHHGRFWNRPSPTQPRWPNVPELAHIQANNKALTRTYGLAALTRYMLRCTSPTTEWSDRLKALCATFPVSSAVSLNAAGFPLGWQAEALWQ
jgi:abortive infection bacteriophage resistance protein